MYLIAQLKNLFRYGAIALCLIFAAALLLGPEYAAAGIRRGLSMCYTAVIPALFPFLFLVDYLFSYLCARNSTKKWIGIAAAIIFGLIGGFPMGTKALGDLVARGELGPKKASYLLAGCVNAGPAYLISAVGMGLFGSPRAGLLMLCALSVSSLICLAVALYAASKLPETIRAFHPAKKSKPDFAGSLTYALKATLTFCAYVLLFACIGQYLQVLLAPAGLPILNWSAAALLEVVSGCAAAAEIGSVPGFLLAGASVSLCGISVILQIRAIAQANGMTLRYFFLSRPLHLITTLVFLRLSVPLFPTLTDVYANTLAYRIYSLSPLFSLFFILVAVIFVLSNHKHPLFTNS